MAKPLRFHLAQLNPTVGDIPGNTAKIVRAYNHAVDDGSDCVIFTELATVGYPPQDLLYLDQFIEDNVDALYDIAEETGKIPALVGFVDERDNQIYNAVAVLYNGGVHQIVHKRLLPTYDVFDEARYFACPSEVKLPKVPVGGIELSLGIHICEDLWDGYYKLKPVDELAAAGADMFINLSASPFYSGKVYERIDLAKKKSQKFHTPFLYCSQAGGQDELIYDGNSFALDADGELLAKAKAFDDDLVAVEIDIENGTGTQADIPQYSREEEIFRALKLGLHDYCRKAGFESAVMGLSGGIDSSLTAVIAKEALGAENVYGISMPSQFSSDHSKSDAQLLAENLGIHYDEIAIHDTYQSYLNLLKSPLDGTEPDETEENIQARIRGNILMAYSNKFGHIVLSTGNKTELALGYCTLYGDMTGGLAVISDVSKMDVYGLCQWYNHTQNAEIVPENVLTKPPSAELKEDQEDPFDYNVVSPLVDEIIERHRSMDELIAMGFDRELVRDIKQMIKRAEYKRRQAAPGLKVTRKSFGSGRRVPIINHYREEEV